MRFHTATAKMAAEQSGSKTKERPLSWQWLLCDWTVRTPPPVTLILVNTDNMKETISEYGLFEQPGSFASSWVHQSQAWIVLVLAIGRSRVDECSRQRWTTAMINHTVKLKRLLTKYFWVPMAVKVVLNQTMFAVTEWVDIYRVYIVS